jgi:hypothetical protein
MNMQAAAGARQQTGVRHQHLARPLRNVSSGAQLQGQQPLQRRLKAAVGAQPAN